MSKIKFALSRGKFILLAKIIKKITKKTISWQKNMPVI